MNERQIFKKNLYIPIFVIVIIIVIVWIWCIWWPCPQVTTVFVVRHADRDDDFDYLNVEGQQRANELAGVLSRVDVDVIYVTESERTRQTALPVAVDKDLEDELIQYGNIGSLVDEVNQDHVGKEVLIVGHSNTVPMIVDSFIGESTEYFVDPDEFYKIFILTIESGECKWVTQLKYGVVP